MSNAAQKVELTEYRLPSPPQVLAKIIAAASNPEVSAVALSKMLGSDPAFAAEILRVANSSWFGGSSQVTSLMRAVAMLGNRSLRNMALCAAARNCVDPKELGDFDLRRYWEDSLRRAVASQLLAEHLKLGDPSEAFTAGLLQDLGVLALVLTKPGQALEWMEMVDGDPEVRRSAEDGIFGATHDGLGAKLAEVWSLPEELASPLRFHHDPTAAADDQRRRCEVGRWAELLAGVFTRDDKKTSVEDARRILATEAGIDDELFNRFVAQLGPRVQEVATAMGLDVEEQPSLESILIAANKGLADMNLSYEELVHRLEDTLATLNKTLAEKEALTAELEQRNRELHQLSVTDTLTGLPNRRALAGRISYEVPRIARSGASLTMLLGDVDHFKRCNDTYGHEFGDKVLQAVAVTMGSCVRQTDMVARIGGEEFAVLLPDTDLPGAEVVARKILEAIAAREIPGPAGQAVRVTISLGIAHVTGPHKGNVNPDSIGLRLYKTADAELYRSKEGGRNRFTAAVQAIPFDDPTT